MEKDGLEAIKIESQPAEAKRLVKDIELFWGYRLRVGDGLA